LLDASQIDVCGIATDVCVKSTVEDLVLLKNQYDKRVRIGLLSDLCVGVTKEGHEDALQRMSAFSIVVK
jgi:nicotinamidase-related amidase